MLHFVAVTAAGAWYAGRAFAVVAAFAVGAFAVWVRAASVFYHDFHLLYGIIVAGTINSCKYAL